MLGIYLHVPFCVRRCNYCDFCSSVLEGGALEEYAAALVRSIEAFPGGGKADSVYFGGGTPSLLPAGLLEKIMNAVGRKFSLSGDCEVTLEANPNTVDEEKLRGYRSLGVNRISFGIQSCKDNELYTLGRLHSFSEAKRSVEAAQRAGFENISGDIMLGIPHQTPETALESVHKICGLGLCHVSAYMLKIEEGTRFDCPEIRALCPDDDTVADIYLAAVWELSRLGFEQYEISNFARPGRESRHNMKYWTGEEYIGFGPSAHSYYSGKRFYFTDDIAAFVKDPLEPAVTEDNAPDRLAEYVMLGLRLCKGIKLDGIEKLGGNAAGLGDLTQKYIAAGLMKKTAGGFALTPEGFLVSNGIIAEILDKTSKK